jgi:hypothetical protein
MGTPTHAAVAADSTYVVWLNDRPIPEIPWTVLEPGSNMTYGERLALMADMGLPLMIKMRESQHAPQTHRQCLWVGGRIEPVGDDDDARFRWPSGQRLCADFADGTRIWADSVFALPRGDALDPLEPLLISPRRSGWQSSFSSIEVKHRRREIVNTRRHLFVAFPACDFMRRRLEWTDCTRIALVPTDEHAAVQQR